MDAPSTFDVPRGQRAPGSQYYRDYCTRCRAPLRVTEDGLKVYNYCEDCDPPHTGVGNPHTIKEDRIEVLVSLMERMRGQ